MTEYCLTTQVHSGQGTIQQPGCSWAEKGPLVTESCAQNFEEGTSISLKANPYTNWSVGRWYSSVAGIFVGDPTGSTSAQIIMPSQDVTVTVSFIHEDVNLSAVVAGGEGCIAIESPSGYSIPCRGGTILLPAEDIRVRAIPDTGYEVQRWELDGSTYDSAELYVDFPVYGYTQREIKVYFSEIECDTNTLTISVEGRGSVSVPSGEYCDYLTLTLNPIPAKGYFFRGWEYTGDDIVAKGSSLLVPMSIDRNIKAIFELSPGYEEQNYSLFYCPSETNRTNTVDFDYQNTDENPSASNQFHFRATFYSNSEKTKTLYSAFSLIDNKRWYYDNGSFHQIPSDGVEIDANSTMSIIYVPEILPQELANTQKEETIDDILTTEFSLLCGVRYYVDIESYNMGDGVLEFKEAISLIVDCSDTEAFYRSYNEDETNWVCSGQDNSDLKVAGSRDQSLFPHVASNNVGLFQIIWESRRNEVAYLYGAQWDSRDDLLYSSGQGMYDKKFLDVGYNPIILTDQANNFYIAANSTDSIYKYACPLTSVDDIQPIETTEVSFERLCYPGQTNFLSSAIDAIKIRVYDEDIVNSIVVNKDKAIPVVEKQRIRFDIDGINSLYAVRLRDSNDRTWSKWINIDSALYQTEGEDITTNAYKIDNNRIIVPWTIDRINGVRRVCCQLLTLYGITPTVCVELFMNMDNIEYAVEFYTDSDLTNSVPVYNGYPVLSQIRDENGNVVGNSDDGITYIYVKAVFNEDILTQQNGIYYYGENEYVDNDDVRFNVVQQGVEDIWGQPMQRIDNRTFKGSFKLYKHDGVFNKDGRAFIQILLPDSIGANLCLSDNSDTYNLMVNSADAGRYSDLVPEEIFNQYKNSQISKLLDPNSFKQYYNIDDDNFKFGNPDIFRK